MVNAQEWVDKNYPNKNIKELDISNRDLEGDLDLNEFTNLEHLECDCNQLTSLRLNSCSRLTELWCGHNMITALNLTNLDKLEVVECNDNYLTEFDYSSLNPSKLRELNLSNNNLPNQDISIFSSFTNLAGLWVGNGDQTKNNRFFGSLASLKSLNKLYSLSLNNSNCTAGLGDLPPNLKVIYCLSSHQPNSRIKELEEQVKNADNFSIVKGGTPGQYATTVSEDAQQWLDTYYLQESRSNIRFLTINNLNLIGSLSLTGFDNLKDLYCSNNRLVSLDVNYCSKLQTINCYNNQLANLGLNCCQQLKEVDCSQNKLFQLLLPIKNNLQKLTCENNFLTKLDWLALSTEQLVILDLGNNNFVEQDLSILATFTNLKEVYLGNNNQKKIEEGIYNRFCGSLAFLKNLYKLKWLGISCTNLDNNIEMLPANLETIIVNEMPEIQKKLKNFIKNRKKGIYSYQAWRETNYYLLWRNNFLSQAEKEKISELDFSNQNLTGQLNLSDFISLQSLNCANNQLTNIVLPSNLISLIKLDLTNNNFPAQDLSIFSQYPNLQVLRIGTTNEDKIKKGVYNRWFGSLQSLQNLTSLKELNIDATDIDSGLECIPWITKLSCDPIRRNAAVKRIYNELGNSQIGTSRFERWKISKEIKRLSEDQDRNFLDYRIKELENMIKEHWEDKVYQAYLHFAPQKDLLEELITTHVEFTKFKKQEAGSSGFGKKCREYNKKCEEIKDKLWAKLSEEEMDEIETVLKDCEEIANWQLELVERKNARSLLLEGQPLSQPSQITFNGPVNFHGGHQNISGLVAHQNNPDLFQSVFGKEKNAKRKLEATDNSETITNIEPAKRLRADEPTNTSMVAEATITCFTELTNKQWPADKYKEFIKAKQVFLTTRQGTIQRLQACCEELETALHLGKYAKTEETSNAVSKYWRSN